jgi:hypothetical protein
MNSEQAGIQNSRFISAGDQVTVQIWAKDVADLAGVNFVVNFDDAQSTYVAGGEPAADSFLRSAGGDAFYPPTQTTATSVDISGAVLSPSEENCPDGTGVVGEITFDVDDQLPLGTEICLTFGTIEFSDPTLTKYTPFIADTTTCLMIPMLLGDFTDGSVVCGAVDGCVDFNDLLLFSTCWGLSEGDSGWCSVVNCAESAGTQTIDFDDLLVFASNWGKCVGD